MSSPVNNEKDKVLYVAGYENNFGGGIATTVVLVHYSSDRLLQRFTISTLVAEIQMFKTKTLPPSVCLSVCLLQ